MHFEIEVKAYLVPTAAYALRHVYKIRMTIIATIDGRVYKITT